MYLCACVYGMDISVICVCVCGCIPKYWRNVCRTTYVFSVLLLNVSCLNFVCYFVISMLTLHVLEFGL